MSVCLCSDIIFECNEFRTQLCVFVSVVILYLSVMSSGPSYECLSL